jgi:hypothetical protein
VSHFARWVSVGCGEAFHPSTAQPTMVHVHRSLVDGNIPGSDLLLRDFKIKLLVSTVRCKIPQSEGEIRLHAV